MMSFLFIILKEQETSTCMVRRINHPNPGVREKEFEKVQSPVYIEIQHGYDVMAGILKGDRR